jgi:hypothetical protein
VYHVKKFGIWQYRVRVGTRGARHRSQEQDDSQKSGPIGPSPRKWPLPVSAEFNP